MSVRNTVVGVVAVVAVAGGILALGHEAANGLEPTEVRTVTVRNDCPHGVWLFYGPRPGLRVTRRDGWSAPWPSRSSATP